MLLQIMGKNMIKVVEFRPEYAGEWKQFLQASNNGTLFHDLDFLAYHPPQRFHTHHLMFYESGELIALLPAAIVTEPDGRRFFKSPYGASVGGFVLPIGQCAVTTLGLVACLQDYVSALDLDGIEMRIGPMIYAKYFNDNLSFALTASGFSLACRWLTHIIALPTDPGEVLNQVPSSRRRGYVRSALRQGVQVKAVGVDYLPSFYHMLEANRAKHGARPTHTLSELERIFQLTPSQVQLFVCELQDEIIAGTLVFELNSRVAYSFYPCHDDRFERYRGTMVVAVRVLEHYTTQGFRYLDLGPTTFDDLSLNQGLARFKEEMGGVGFCRDTWRWERE